MKQFVKIVKEVKGMVSPTECFLFYTLAKSADSDILEIGSWKGKSTCCFALGAVRNLTTASVKVHSIDPFEDSTLHKDLKQDSTFDEYIDNLKEVGVNKTVTPHKMTSEMAYSFLHEQWKQKKFSVIFIDGDHSYESCKKDFDMWTPFLKPGGVLIMHDSVVKERHPGPVMVVKEEIILKPDKWMLWEQVDQSTWAIKR